MLSKKNENKHYEMLEQKYNTYDSRRPSQNQGNYLKPHSNKRIFDFEAFFMEPLKNDAPENSPYLERTVIEVEERKILNKRQEECGKDLFLNAQAAQKAINGSTSKEVTTYDTYVITTSQAQSNQDDSYI